MKQFRAWVCVLAMLSVVGLVRAQDASLPDGKQVLEKYIEATGGRAAYEKFTSRVTKAKMDAPALGIKGNVTITQVAPNVGYVVSEIEGIGTIEQGSDGTIVWEKSAMMGPRLLEGRERESLQRSLTINSELYPDKSYESVKTIGLEDVSGKPCYKVEIVTLAGGKETRFYEKESGLLVKTESVATTQMGEIPIVATAAEYREVDGVKMPFKATQDMMGRQISVTIEEVKHNVDVPKDKLALPADIKALAAKAATQPGK